MGPQPAGGGEAGRASPTWTEAGEHWKGQGYPEEEGPRVPHADQLVDRKGQVPTVLPRCRDGHVYGQVQGRDL